MHVGLQDRTAEDRAVSGGKGRSLARLVARGYRVPPGFVLTTDSLEEVLRRLGPIADEALATADASDLVALDARLAPLREAIVRAPLPDAVARALASGLDALGGDVDDLYAVRSSAVAEDGASASFAGQYETVLGVARHDVAEALRRCYASFFAAHAVAYRASRAQRDLGAAVVVQRLVRARAAGVAFSLDPTTGADDVVVIDANHGLGESVVSGVASPDTFRVARDGTTVEKRLGAKEVRTELVEGGTRTVATNDAERAAFAISDDEARAIAALVTRLAAEEGHPVDVEWAIAEGVLHLLQARPITTRATAPIVVPDDFRASLDTPIDPAYPLFSNGNISEVLPGVISPLAFSSVAPIIDHAFRAQLRETGTMIDDTAGLRVVGFFFHRPYLCVSYLAEAARRSPGVSPDRVYEEFVGKVETTTPAFTAEDFTPRGLARTFRALRATRRRLGTLDADAEATIDGVKAAHRATTEAFARALAGEALARSIVFSPEAAAPSVVHVWASTFAVTLFGALRGLLARWVGDDDGVLAAELVTGLGDLPSADPAFGLFAIAKAIRDDATFLGRFQRAADDAARVAMLRTEANDDLRGAFESFLATHGHRAVCEAEPRTPSWREDPTQVVALVRNYLDPRVEDPSRLRERRERVRSEVEAKVLARLGPLRRFVFRQLVARVRHFVTLRERLKDAIVLRADRLRVIYREIGRRLVARGRLDDPKDVCFLLVDELAVATRETETRAVDLRALVTRRKREFALCEALDVPKLQEGVPRRLDATALPDGDRLVGLGVCPGRVEGRARVILDPRLDAALEPGEILVAPVTDAGWTPLFVQAAALVVDVGGLLSHGSVVAREYGLPAVVGVTGATKRIRTGDRIVVDATKGTVVLLA